MMKARDIIIHNFKDTKSSSAYNIYDQNQALSSAENQVSIANNIVKQATSNLNNRAEALKTAAEHYVTRLNELNSATIANGSSTARISGTDGNRHSIANAQAGSVSSAASSGSSVGKILVSLKSGAGTVYSLVNQTHKK